jgi:branched-subunit amino acid aminotransferase/4-amino-4-deoxychorismate lyase
LVDGRGRLLEGTSSNFFGLRDGVLHTAGTGVLEGVTRSALLSLAAGLGLPVALEPVHRDSIAELDEAFLSSSTRSLVPIVNVAGAAVGDGTPGPVTRRLLAGYRELVEREARPAVAATSP